MPWGTTQGLTAGLLWWAERWDTPQCLVNDWEHEWAWYHPHPSPSSRLPLVPPWVYHHLPHNPITTWPDRIGQSKTKGNAPLNKAKDFMGPKAFKPFAKKFQRVCATDTSPKKVGNRHGSLSCSNHGPEETNQREKGITQGQRAEPWVSL